MNTTKEIINNNQKVEHYPDNYGRPDRVSVIITDYHTDDKDKKWYSEDITKETIDVFRKIIHITDLERERLKDKAKDIKKLLEDTDIETLKMRLLNFYVNQHVLVSKLENLNNTSMAVFDMKHYFDEMSYDMYGIGDE